MNWQLFCIFVYWFILWSLKFFKIMFENSVLSSQKDSVSSLQMPVTYHCFGKCSLFSLRILWNPHIHPVERMQGLSTVLQMTPAEESSLDVNNSVDSQEVFHVLWNAKFHYSIHSSQPLVLALSQINLVCILTLRSI